MDFEKLKALYANNNSQEEKTDQEKIMENTMNLFDELEDLNTDKPKDNFTHIEPELIEELEEPKDEVNVKEEINEDIKKSKKKPLFPLTVYTDHQLEHAFIDASIMGFVTLIIGYINYLYLILFVF